MKSSFKVAISTSSFGLVDPAPLRYLEEKNIEFVTNPYGRKLTEAEIIKHLQGIDGLLAGLEPLNSTVFRKSPKLKAIARIGIGIDNVDMHAAKKYNIKISNTPDGPTDAVAEMTLAAALAISRNLIFANKSLHEKHWEKTIGSGLKNQILFIIGFGRIGQKVSKNFHNMGAKILVYDPFIEHSTLNSFEELVDLNTGLQSADIISLHAGGNAPILMEKEFKLMKNNVIILNCARGNLINEESLVKALDTKKVSSAWLDVFNKEPYNGKLTKYNQVLLTPHMSTYTQQCRKEMEMTAVKNLLRDLNLQQ